ncbi:hypothetical protein Hanom_Chr03g00222881 [Helianthus anomalus]
MICLYNLGYSVATVIVNHTIVIASHKSFLPKKMVVHLRQPGRYYGPMEPRPVILPLS